MLEDATKTMEECIVYVKEQGIDYMDLYGRKLVDTAINIICGYLFCQQASSKFDMDTSVDNNGKTVSMKKRKVMVARRYITRNAPNIKARADAILAGCKSSFEQYDELAGAVPIVE